jgi:nitric oxide reductase NorD protein
MSSSRPFSDRASPAPAARIPRVEIEAALDRLLDPVLSARRTVADVAARIALLARTHQDFVLHWVVVVARTNIELAYQFAAAAPEALAVMEPAIAEGWVVEAMDRYDQEGLHRAAQVLRSPSAYLERSAEPAAVRLEDVAPTLQIFLRALSGRRLRIESAPEAYTDGETI